MQEKTYKELNDLENIRKLREVLKSLPAFLKTYFRSLETTKSTRTRLSYAYDLSIFFEFLRQNNPQFAKQEPASMKIPADILDGLTKIDIEEYMSFLQEYQNKDGKNRSNKDSGILRKMAALRSMYHYYYINEDIKNNAPAQIVIPKKHTKNIIRLDVDEVADMIDYVESGEKLTAAQRRTHEKTKLRDTAIVTLLLGTGIRVSECVGLDLSDVDFRNNRIRIIRKGGNEDIVYFGDEVEDALKAYINLDRNQIEPLEEHRQALFISLKKQRMSVRSVERMVKKYASQVTTVKKITPHKLRSTYGTNLYNETGDIYLVAEVLGHKDVNTTQKHYAASSEDRKRRAASIVRLREE
ncbi:MAG: tyrosine-type recombinase/integrase [Lachnospiraceae bacterium]|nr:tyrosine-type recombinase/integrase [Lachnospiraceae bacterium]